MYKDYTNRCDTGMVHPGEPYLYSDRLLALCCVIQWKEGMYEKHTLSNQGDAERHSSADLASAVDPG